MEVNNGIVKKTSQQNVLFVAHPGHEVLLHGWLEKARPLIMILTDGSGRSDQPRIGGAGDYVDSLGLTRGPIFGRYSDLDIYQRILEQDFEFFNGLANEVTEILLDCDAEFVVADSAEGYNCNHDVCRLLINSAIARAETISQRPLENYEYPVVGGIYTSFADQGEAEKIHLDQSTFERKLAAVEKHYPTLFVEVRDAISRKNNPSHLENVNTGRRVTSQCDPDLDFFRTEYLRPFTRDRDYLDLVGIRPYYERCGEERAAQGFYAKVIRSLEHMIPIARSLRRDSATALGVYS